MTTPSAPSDQVDDVDTEEAEEADSLSHEKGLYRHIKRHEWGLAILASEENGRRSYQFDDGVMRVFKDGFYGLMVPAEESSGHESAVVADLRTTISLNRGASNKALKAAYPFSVQLEIFAELYPKGFQDKAWIAKHRRRDDGRALKRHHGMAADQAKLLLSAAAFGARAKDAPSEEMHAAILEVLGSTDLVPTKRLRQLEALNEIQRTEFVNAVHQLLHGTGDYGLRFKAFMRCLREVLGERPSWSFATSLGALVHPKKHSCVRYSTFIRQAGLTAPEEFYSKRPRGGAYENFLQVAVEVQRLLKEAGQKPADLLDVHNFIWTTLRPAAAKSVTA